VEERALRSESTVPVEVIELPRPELAGLSEADYAVSGEKVT
jgi:hypothetical protein